MKKYYGTLIKRINLDGLDLTNAKVGISKYKIFEELPEYLEKRLNEK